MDPVKPKRISRKTRQQAALICDVAASSDSFHGYGSITMAIDASPNALYLACAAYLYATSKARVDNGQNAHDAEAAQLIREGWSPR